MSAIALHRHSTEHLPVESASCSHANQPSCTHEHVHHHVAVLVLEVVVVDHVRLGRRGTGERSPQRCAPFRPATPARCPSSQGRSQKDHCPYSETTHPEREVAALCHEGKIAARRATTTAILRTVIVLLALLASLVTGGLVALGAFTLGVEHYGMLAAIGLMGGGLQLLALIACFLYATRARSTQAQGYDSKNDVADQH